MCVCINTSDVTTHSFHIYTSLSRLCINTPYVINTSHVTASTHCMSLLAPFICTNLFSRTLFIYAGRSPYMRRTCPERHLPRSETWGAGVEYHFQEI